MVTRSKPPRVAFAALDDESSQTTTWKGLCYDDPGPWDLDVIGYSRAGMVDAVRACRVCPALLECMRKTSRENPRSVVQAGIAFDARGHTVPLQCGRGHDLTLPEGTLELSNGERRCRICNREDARAAAQRKRLRLKEAC